MQAISSISSNGNHLQFLGSEAHADYFRVRSLAFTVHRHRSRRSTTSRPSERPPRRRLLCAGGSPRSLAAIPPEFRTHARPCGSHVARHRFTRPLAGPAQASSLNWDASGNSNEVKHDRHVPQDVGHRPLDSQVARDHGLHRIDLAVEDLRGISPTQPSARASPAARSRPCDGNRSSGTSHATGRSIARAARCCDPAR